SETELLQRIKHVVIMPKAIEIRFPDAHEGIDEARAPEPIMSLPWAPQKFVAVKGISRSASENIPALKTETRNALLAAIAKARVWVDDLVSGRIESIKVIAQREEKVERHIRLLLPLAFASPALVQHIADCSAPANTTVTGLAKEIPLFWGI
ncbi:MAG TPA: hypothetical protein VH189_01155, partial [Rhizomicrobium sp.]|nr:hypothetical protein [Rhizomicrobium sp.]